MPYLRAPAVVVVQGMVVMVLQGVTVVLINAVVVIVLAVVVRAVGFSQAPTPTPVAGARCTTVVLQARGTENKYHTLKPLAQTVLEMTQITKTKCPPT